MCILFVRSLVLETSGDIESGYFSVNIGVGLNENGDVPFSFPMLIVFSSFYCLLYLGCFLFCIYDS